MSSDALMRLPYLSQPIHERIQQEHNRSFPSLSIPLRSRGLNPEAKEFVPSQPQVRVPPQPQVRVPPQPQVRFSDILQQGEIVYLTLAIGQYEDGYPILSICATVYNGHLFTVSSCEDVPHMVGQRSEKPGRLLYAFIRGLKRAGKLQHEPKGSVWRHCHVKRDGKHLSFTRLAQMYLDPSCSS